MTFFLFFCQKSIVCQKNQQKTGKNHNTSTHQNTKRPRTSETSTEAPSDSRQRHILCCTTHSANQRDGGWFMLKPHSQRERQSRRVPGEAGTNLNAACVS
jgi:hypothetical protein